jgi:hypothetical protein
MSQMPSDSGCHLGMQPTDWQAGRSRSAVAISCRAERPANGSTFGAIQTAIFNLDKLGIGTQPLVQLGGHGFCRCLAVRRD